MDSPEDLYQCGIFINDLAMHDSTREYILAGSQQNPELNLALNQVREREIERETLIICYYRKRYVLNNWRTVYKKLMS